MQTIKGCEIQNLITRYYYNGCELCFQIMFLLTSGTEPRRALYKEYNDFNAYKSDYKQLRTAVDSNQDITITPLF